MAKQQFKCIHFSDCSDSKESERTITIAFSESEQNYYEIIQSLSSVEIKEVIGYSNFNDIEKLAIKEDRSINQTIKRLIKKNMSIDTKNTYTEKDVTFKNSKAVPFQRWYPYIEGYSPDFVKSLISKYVTSNELIYEPFAGTGTTLFASDNLGYNTVYSEVNPLLQFLINTKMQIMQETEIRRKDLAQKVLYAKENLFLDLNKTRESKLLLKTYNIVFGKSKYFEDNTLKTILKLRTYIDKEEKDDKLFADILSIAVFSCLLPSSFLKKQGDVRFKTPSEIEKEMKKIEDILPEKLADIALDISSLTYEITQKHTFIVSNAKDISTVKDVKIGSIITSPPYLNGTNYFRNTKLELWFLKLLNKENDLRIYRDQILTSGINDVRKEYKTDSDNINIQDKSPLLKDTIIDLEKNAYDKRIPLMALSYFKEMYCFFRDVRTLLSQDAKILVDLGDSIFSGIHIQTDKILAEILESLGYVLIENNILRKRRSRNGAILSQVLLFFQLNK